MENNAIAEDLHKLATQFRDAAMAVCRLEAELSRRQAEFKVLREVVIPEAMERLGTTLYRIPEDGTVIEIELETYARIEKEKEEAAFDWLEAQGEGGIIKRQVIVAFAKNQEEAALALKKELTGRFAGVKTKSDVHWATLTSWAKKRLEEGEDIDDSITVDQKNVAKLK